MKKVIGIGGIFFKCQDVVGMKDWYNKYFGLEVGFYGVLFEWYEDVEGKNKGLM